MQTDSKRWQSKLAGNYKGAIKWHFVCNITLMLNGNWFSLKLKWQSQTRRALSKAHVSAKGLEPHCYSMFTPPTQTSHNCHALWCRCRQCEHNCKPVLSRLDPVSNLQSQTYGRLLKTWILKTGSWWEKTHRNCSWQNKTVLSCLQLCSLVLSVSAVWTSYYQLLLFVPFHHNQFSSSWGNRQKQINWQMPVTI